MNQATSERLGTPVLDLRMLFEFRAPADRVWDHLIRNMDGWWRGAGDEAMGLVLEATPGGRLYRDLGEGAGHLWAHVQVIKPPSLLELIGPLFISEPSLSHVAFRLSEREAGVGGGSVMLLTHRAVGVVPAGFAEGVQSGWGRVIGRLSEYVERDD